MFIQERLHDYIYIHLHRLHRYRSPLCSHLFTHFGLFLELKSKVTGNPAKRVSFSLALSPWWFACCRQGLALSRWVVESLSPWGQIWTKQFAERLLIAFAEAHSSDSGASCCLGLHSCRWLCDDVVNTRLFLFFNNIMLLLCYIF